MTTQLEIPLRRPQGSIAVILTRLRCYWPLIKGLQTGLLLLTGLAGFLSARGFMAPWPTVLALAGSLTLAISGSTILNMVLDRDLDTCMQRTARRPLPTRQLGARQAGIAGVALSVAGTGWALALAPVYGAIVFAGLFFDVAIYTIWLKRRSPFSILIGGLAGGMPALAGRALATGQADLVGVLMALGVLFWIPTHIMTLSMRHDADYRAAGVPTFPIIYGFATTRAIIAASALTAGAAMLGAAYLICVPLPALRALAGLSAVLFGLAGASLIHPSTRLNFALFKYASLYMLGAMVILAL